MKIEGSFEVSVTSKVLWDLLQDPEFLKEVMPGCKEIKQTGEDEFVGIIEAKVGAIASQYTTKFSIHDKNPPHSYRMHLEGEGKGGFVRADVNVSLEPSEAGTLLKYAGNVAIGGTIARIGQRLLDAAAKMLLNQGFKALKKKVEERAAQ
ncbi:MAG: carbon monoxide dehydrogenase subunit G [Calditrichaeota bacterium]|nr:carbon monoxide dehydrogenase subunit G [Calditrichota bacterium]